VGRHGNPFSSRLHPWIIKNASSAYFDNRFYRILSRERNG
jgi:hypothetical protein